MKSLVIYYSLEGNTKLISKSISEEIGADILELKPKKDIKPRRFMKYVWGGKAVFMKEKPDLLPLNKNIDDYDILFIGSPVWAGTYTPVFRTFFSEHKILNKKVALFCCHGGGKGKFFKKMYKELCDNDILGEIDFKEPLKNNTKEAVSKVKEWAKEINCKIS